MQPCQMCQQEAMLLSKKLSQYANQQWILRGLLGGDVALQKLELGALRRTLRKTPNFLVQSEKDLVRLLQAYGSSSSSSNGEKKPPTTTTKDTLSSSLADLSCGSAITYHRAPIGRSEGGQPPKQSSTARRRILVSGDLSCSEKLPPVLDHERIWYPSEML